MSDKGFISAYFVEIERMIDQFTFKGYENVSHDIAPIIYLCIGIYIALTGIMMMRGSIELSHKAFTDMIWTIVLALTLALNWGFVSQYIYKFFNYGAIGISSAVFDTISNYSGGTDSLYTHMQEVWDKQTAIGDHFHAQVTWKNISPAFYGWLVYGVSGILILMTLLEVTVLKMGFAMCIVFMPVYAVLLLFPKFSKSVDAYYTAMLGTFFALIFVLGGAALGFHLIEWSLKFSYGDTTGVPSDITNASIFPFLIVSGIAMGFLGYAMKMGYSSVGSLGGGQTGSGMIAGAIGLAYSKMNAPAKAAGKVAGKRGGQVLGATKKHFLTKWKNWGE